MWRGYSLTWYHLGAEDWFQILFLRAKSIGRKACASVKKKKKRGLRGKYKKGKSEVFGLFTRLPRVDPSWSSIFQNLSVLILGKVHNLLSCLVALDFGVPF